jgi:hypothetical protein
LDLPLFPQFDAIEELHLPIVVVKLGRLPTLYQQVLRNSTRDIAKLSNL